MQWWHCCPHDSWWPFMLTWPWRVCRLVRVTHANIRILVFEKHWSPFPSPPPPRWCSLWPRHRLLAIDVLLSAGWLPRPRLCLWILPPVRHHTGLWYCGGHRALLLKPHVWLSQSEFYSRLSRRGQGGVLSACSAGVPPAPPQWYTTAAVMNTKIRFRMSAPPPPGDNYLVRSQCSPKGSRVQLATGAVNLNLALELLVWIVCYQK